MNNSTKYFMLMAVINGLQIYLKEHKHIHSELAWIDEYLEYNINLIENFNEEIK